MYTVSKDAETLDSANLSKNSDKELKWYAFFKTKIQKNHTLFSLASPYRLQKHSFTMLSSMHDSYFSCFTIDRCDAPMGVQDKRVASQSMTASSYQSSTYAPSRARLHLPYGWTPRHNRRGQWLEVDFSAMAKVTRVATQGRSNSYYWVKSYYVTHSKDRSTFITYKEYRRRKVRSFPVDCI